MANTYNKLAKLAERDSLLSIDYYYKGVAICGVRMEYSLSQRWQDGFRQLVKVAIVRGHNYIRGI
jgi:hypothetical protein